MGKCSQSINSGMLGKGENCTDVINGGSYIHQKYIQVKVLHWSVLDTPIQMVGLNG